jgi:hypothetical protein
MYDDPVSRALAVIRQHYDDGGDVEPLMSRVMERVGDKAIHDSHVLEPEAVLKPGPEQSVWEKISSKFMGDRPSPERRRFVEGLGNIADVAHMGAYATPLAPAMGAVDFARGVASGDPMEAVLGATGLPGRAAKAAGVAASAMMPGEAEAGPLSNALKAIRAYHGSPHQFDKFDLSKIGTGEGHQAYGHGLYFAENEPVAKSYRDALTDPDQFPLQFRGRPVDTVWNDEISNRWNDVVGKLPKGHEEDFQTVMGNLSQINDLDQLKHIRASLDRRQNSILDRYILPELSKPEIGPGHMYEVDIHANPEHLLDWDRPLYRQPNNVRDVLEKLGISTEPRGKYSISPTKTGKYTVRNVWGEPSGTFKSEENALRKVEEGTDRHNQAGGMFAYGQLGGNTAYSHLDKGVASNKLLEAGIPGIRYLDQGSRGTGKGSSNYVVFDPNLIEILRRYKDGGHVE